MPPPPTSAPYQLPVKLECCRSAAVIPVHTELLNGDNNSTPAPRQHRRRYHHRLKRAAIISYRVRSGNHTGHHLQHQIMCGYLTRRVAGPMMRLKRASLRETVVQSRPNIGRANDKWRRPGYGGKRSAYQHRIDQQNGTGIWLAPSTGGATVPSITSENEPDRRTATKEMARESNNRVSEEPTRGGVTGK